MKILHTMICLAAAVAVGAMSAEPCFGAPLPAADITIVGDGNDKGTAQLTDPLSVRPSLPIPCRCGPTAAIAFPSMSDVTRMPAERA